MVAISTRYPIDKIVVNNLAKKLAKFGKGLKFIVYLGKIHEGVELINLRKKMQCILEAVIA